MEVFKADGKLEDMRRKTQELVNQRKRALKNPNKKHMQKTIEKWKKVKDAIFKRYTTKKGGKEIEESATCEDCSQHLRSTFTIRAGLCHPCYQSLAKEHKRVLKQIRKSLRTCESELPT